MIAGKRILLIVSGGIAAYKCWSLSAVSKNVVQMCVCSNSGWRAICGAVVPFSPERRQGLHEIFSLTDEAEMGHIQLSRDADLLVVAPASADIMARMAGGLANDLATTVLLATDKPVMFVPAMNVRMWEHPATQANIETLESRGLTRIGPNSGNMACGEYGLGRMSEPSEVVEAIEGFFAGMRRPLLGRRALVTSGPTREAIDPVRYLSNHSSGKQGHAIATALAGLGAETSLVTGPVALADPSGVNVLHVESAAEMLSACQAALPADIAVCAAAVSDWRVADAAPEKLKKDGSGPPPLADGDPDILQTLSKAENRRPGLVEALPQRPRMSSKTPSTNEFARAATGFWRTMCPLKQVLSVAIQYHSSGA